MVVQAATRLKLPARLCEFIAKVDRLEAVMWRHALADTEQAQRDLNEAIALAAIGDYATAEQMLCDWEATVVELLDGPLHVDLAELRSRPRTGLPAEQAMEKLWAELDEPDRPEDRGDVAA